MLCNWRALYWLAETLTNTRHPYWPPYWFKIEFQSPGRMSIVTFRLKLFIRDWLSQLEDDHQVICQSNLSLLSMTAVDICDTLFVLYNAFFQKAYINVFRWLGHSYCWVMRGQVVIDYLCKFWLRIAKDIQISEPAINSNATTLYT